MPHIVKKSFADVGLWPWKPERIWENCLKHTPVSCNHKVNRMMREMIDAINNLKQKQDAAANQILSGLEPASITNAENYDFQIFKDDDDSEGMVDDDEEDSSHHRADVEDMSFQPRAKRSRTPSSNRKTCSARGCHRSHVRSKKWVECPNCKKNFCPAHAGKLHNHKC